MSFKTSLALALLRASITLAANDTRTYGINYFWMGKPLVESRMDPIISPGEVSNHVHTILGGDGFAYTMDNNAAADASCTGARVLADKSNYWVPKLYHDNGNGTFTDVEMFYAKAYYFFEPSDDELVAFPNGFRMMSGNAMQRNNTYTTPYADNTDPGLGEVQPISFSCPQTGTSDAYPNQSNTGQGAGFPDVMCNGYASPLRYNVHFPSCIDMSQPFTNYKTNTAWPSSEGTSDPAEGNRKVNCPSGYIHVPHLFLEVYWNTMAFTDWTPGQGNQPFVLAQGDATGYGLHADFIAGWGSSEMYNLIANCNAGAHGDGLDSCPGVNAYSGTPTDCSISPPTDEQVTGLLDALPGCNPIQAGPGQASICDCSSGKPVCDGSAPSEPAPGNGTSPTTTPTASSSAASTAIATPTPSESSSAGSGSSGGSGNTGGSGKPGKSGDNGGDGGDDGDDGGDDDECGAPEETPTATPKPQVGRRSRHLSFHEARLQHMNHMH